MLAPFVLGAVLSLKIDPQVAARFDPEVAIGATVDAHEEGDTPKIFTRPNVSAMLSAGFHPLSYRLATELDGEAWHWNPRGTWSGDDEGYWTSDDHSPAPITVSYGFRLPRRGNTLDQARNDDYSRIDDGDPATFWKSNPYLDGRPQWVVIDLEAPQAPDAIRIDWAEPFAVDYDVQYWTGDDAINNPPGGTWVTFDRGAIRGDRGGSALHELGHAPHTVRFVRVWLATRCAGLWPAGMAASGTATGGRRPPDRPAGGRHTGGDWRDGVGFAIAEISLRANGRELIRHAKTHNGQSVISVSSTDPWHRAGDHDTDLEQPGLDLVFDSGLTRGLPLLTPVALLYGTPEDAAAEIRYLRARHRKVSMIELGEEPDGQNMAPEDYAALYMRWADALHAIDPSLRLGGPAFQSTRDVIAFWPDAGGNTSWIGRFVAALRARGRLGDFAFFSFEWYPFDDVCDDPREQLLDGPELLRKVLAAWRDEGLPRTIPWLATEYGWSSFAAEAEVDIYAALFNAEFLADFLAEGGSAAYFYGLEPDVIIREHCNAYGNLILFQSDAAHRIRAPVAAFHGAQLVTKSWLAQRGVHELHRVIGGNERVRGWAVRRPDGSWAWLLINKGSTPSRVRLGGALQVTQYSRQDYVWKADGPRGRAVVNRPPGTFAAKQELELPAYSLTVATATRSRPVSAAPR